MTPDMTKLAEITKPLALARGVFFVVEFSAKGGTTYHRIGEEHSETHEDESLTAEYSTRKEVDHIGLAKWSRQIINQAYGVMERHCSPTPIGYWISEEKVSAMLLEIAAVKEEAGKLNRFAAGVNSRRRAHIDIYAMTVGQEDEVKTAMRLAQTVRERLESLREDLVNGDLNAYATSWKRARNLPRLATGIQAESIVLALEAARELRAKVYEGLKTIKGAKPIEIGKTLDTTAIDSAIFLFTDSVNGTLAVVEDPKAEKGAA